jgi:hypothetical protein
VFGKEYWMTQTTQGMGFEKERRELEEEKQRRPD